MKKHDIAKKMNRKNNVEGDREGIDVYENKFSKQDVKKEKKTRVEKHSKMPKNS